MDRWATFDCYGTLIDWNGGIGRELERLFGAEHVARLLNGYHELEREIEHERPAATYRDVLTTALCRLAEREDMPLAAADEDALARSLPTWQPFPEAAAALEDARARGWKLAILSNTDRDYLDASLELIGVPFDVSIVASEIGSYKPGHRHWETFAERVSPDGARARRREPLPRHRAGDGARPADRVDQPARRGARAAAGRRASLADRARRRTRLARA